MLEQEYKKSLFNKVLTVNEQIIDRLKDTPFVFNYGDYILNDKGAMTKSEARLPQCSSDIQYAFCRAWITELKDKFLSDLENEKQMFENVLSYDYEIKERETLEANIIDDNPTSKENKELFYQQFESTYFDDNEKEMVFYIDGYPLTDEEGASIALVHLDKKTAQISFAWNDNIENINEYKKIPEIKKILDATIEKAVKYKDELKREKVNFDERV